MPANHVAKGACAIALLGPAAAASAGLFASFNLNDTLGYSSGEYPDVETGKKQINAQTVPFQQTDSLSSAGGVITSNYSVTDNGDLATLSFDTSASTTAAYNDLAEGSGDYPYTTFSFTVPVNFSLTLAFTGAGDGSIYAGGPPGLEYVGIEGGDLISTSGTFGADTVYSLQETFTLDNTESPQVPNLSGEQSFTFTFTPIPEPLTGAVPVLLAFAAHRRRWRASLLSPEADTRNTEPTKRI